MTVIENSRVVDLRFGSVPVGRASPRDGARSAKPSNMYIRNTHLSKVHARLWFEDPDVFVEDMGLTFGTVLNDKLLMPEQPQRLCEGDVLGFIVNRPLAVIEQFRGAGKAVLLAQLLSPRVRLLFTVTRCSEEALELQPLAGVVADASMLLGDDKQTPEVREDVRTPSSESFATNSSSCNDTSNTSPTTGCLEVVGKSRSDYPDSNSDAPEEESFVKEFDSTPCWEADCVNKRRDMGSSPESRSGCDNSGSNLAYEICNAACDECESGYGACSLCVHKELTSEGVIEDTSEDQSTEISEDSDEGEKSDAAYTCACDGECSNLCGDIVDLRGFQSCEDTTHFHSDDDSHDDEDYMFELNCVPEFETGSAQESPTLLSYDLDSCSRVELEDMVELASQFLDSELSDSVSDSEDGLEIHVSPLPSALSRKRKYTEIESDKVSEASSEGVPKAKKQRLLLGTVAKETAKGLLYAAGTVLALAVYGGYLEQHK